MFRVANRLDCFKRIDEQEGKVVSVLALNHPHTSSIAVASTTTHSRIRPPCARPVRVKRRRTHVEHNESGLPPKADSGSSIADVAERPLPDSCTVTNGLNKLPAAILRNT